MNTHKPCTRTWGYALPLFLALSLLKAEEKPLPAVEIHFIDRHFVPQTVPVPTGTELILKVTNDSHERIEFESFKLNRERVVEAGHTLVLHLPALKKGSYDFFDDFHGDVPQGEIVAQ